MSRSVAGLLFTVPALFVLACESAAPSRSAPSPGVAQSTLMPPLGTAAAFSVLGGSTVTNTGPSSLSNDLGVFPGSALTGFPPGQLTPPAATHAADAVAGQAQLDLGIAYDLLGAEPCTQDLSGQDLGQRTLTPGVFCFSSEALLTGTLVLDAQFNANALFVFKTVSKLTTASNASIRLINGANPCNIFWKVGSSATLGTQTSFTGNIVALTSISLQTGASLNGRALARNGAVTLDTNLIRSDRCAQASQPDAGTEGGGALTCCHGAVACGATCANLQTDANHCGACGHSCLATETCDAGACTPCSSARTQCTDQCADLNSDPFNCGGCGIVCGTHQSCVAGTCGACDGTVCANACVELRTSVENCGACGHACAADQCCNAGVCAKGEPGGPVCRHN